MPTPAPGVPPGFDDAIALPPGVTPTPSPTPDPFRNPETDEFMKRPLDENEPWDPKKPFPGNYYALPLTVDLGWWPCLDCGDYLYQRPGVISLWGGYAFQPWAASTSPFLAVGMEYQLAEIDPQGHWYGRERLSPTARAGYNFSAAALYATGGVILPSEGRDGPGYHVGVGVSSFAFLVLGLCTAEAIPSVVEVRADFLPDDEADRTKATWAIKLGWGF